MHLLIEEDDNKGNQVLMHLLIKEEDNKRNQVSIRLLIKEEDIRGNQILAIRLLIKEEDNLSVSESYARMRKKHEINNRRQLQRMPGD